VVPVARQLDLKALAAALGAKRATMADPALAARSSGYVLGGISPIGQRTRLATVLDRSAEAYPTILVSAGRRGLQVELAVTDLVRVTGATVTAIAH
jgi:Cys-tRNA(Pro)/Cys-tRNA(Cys) deacylase